MKNNFVTNNKAYIAVDIPREYEQSTETLHDADTINVRDTDRGINLVILFDILFLINLVL